MKKSFIILISLFLITFAYVRCTKGFPVDPNGLLITTRDQCYVSNFELLGSDFLTVRAATAVIDTTALTINTTVYWGTDLKNLYPQFTLVTDAILDPKITGKVDFSDLANPKTYTVISGSRKIKKTYTVIITVQTKP